MNMVTMNEVVILSWLLHTVMSSPLVDGMSAQHKRVKRWQRHGNKVWKEPVKIGFKSYTNILSRWDQDQILRECTNMWTRPGYLEFIIVRPTPQNPAQITISSEPAPDNRTLAYSFAPQPQDPKGTRIVLGYIDRKLKLRKYDEKGSSFKLILCHEIGHTLGLNHSESKSSLMYYSADLSEASDHVLDPDSKRGIDWLYRTPYSQQRQSQSPQRYQYNGHNSRYG